MAMEEGLFRRSGSGSPSKMRFKNEESRFHASGNGPEASNVNPDSRLTL
jgi:hypothetical protein